MTTPRRAVAYVTTHHPRVSLTFIFDEIAGIEAQGITVHPIAINPPDDADIDRPGFRRETERTLYLKSSPKGAVLAALWRAFRAGPGAFLATLLVAWKSAGTDARRLVWRTFHFVEAMLIWDHCRRVGVRHLHAHFAQLPSTLAWLATDFANRVDDETWTFSVTVHGPHELFDEREAWFRAKTSAAELVVGICDFTAAQIKRVTDPADWHKVRVVRCGIDLDRFAFEPRPVPGDPPVVSMVARLSPEKGHLVLVEAMGLLRDRGVAAVARIVGGGHFREAIEARIAELDLAQVVELVGELHTDDVAAHLRSIDVFCLPSFFEGLPISIMEAMATGVPVVATAVGGIPELVHDARTGWLVPAGRADALADALAQVLADPADRATVVVAARAAVERDHDGRRTIPQLAELLRGSAPA